MNHTTNYNLSQWDAGDKVLHTDFNADNAKIDAAIKAVDGRVDSLSSTVSGKAPASAVSSLQSQINAHTAALDKKGNIRMEVFTYTGTGKFGPNNPTTIRFTKRPSIFFVMAPQTFAIFHAVISLGQVIYDTGISDVNVTWTETSAILTTNNGLANWQLNASNTLYRVVCVHFLS